MACRDYDFEYQTWLQRGREHLDKMTALLRQCCRAAAEQSWEIPPRVAKWQSEDKAGRKTVLSKESSDDLAQMLCLMCEVADEKALALPPAVAEWWAKHKTQDEQAEDLETGLAHPPGVASFWEEHAVRHAMETPVTGINHLDAVRALEKVGWRVLRQGKRIVMTDGTRDYIIPRNDPVNGYAMTGLIVAAGLTEEAFRKLL